MVSPKKIIVFPPAVWTKTQGLVFAVAEHRPSASSGQFMGPIPPQPFLNKFLPFSHSEMSGLEGGFHGEPLPRTPLLAPKALNDHASSALYAFSFAHKSFVIVGIPAKYIFAKPYPKWEIALTDLLAEGRCFARQKNESLSFSPNSRWKNNYFFRANH